MKRRLIMNPLNLKLGTDPRVVTQIIYISVWIEEQQKWHYFIGSFDGNQFPHGYVAYYTIVEDGIIVSDTYANDRVGKMFSDIYDLGLFYEMH